MTELIKALESGETHVIRAAMPHGEQTYPCAKAALIGYRAGKEAMRERVEALEIELENIANANPKKWDEDVRDQFQEWAQNRARHTLAKVRSIAQPIPNNPQPDWDNITEADLERLAPLPAEPEWQEFTRQEQQPQVGDWYTFGRALWVMVEERHIGKLDQLDEVARDFGFPEIIYRRRVTNQEGK
jgi:hypothetical protein